MTTIAVDTQGNIAADGRATDGQGYIASDTKPKLKKIDKSTFIASCGRVADIEMMEPMIIDGVIPQEIPNELDAHTILISDGVPVMYVYRDNELISWELSLPYATGSGGQFALAAMDFGLTAKEAIKYAMTRDSSTGGKITTINYMKSVKK